MSTMVCWCIPAVTSRNWQSTHDCLNSIDGIRPTDCATRGKHFKSRDAKNSVQNCMPVKYDSHDLDNNIVLPKRVELPVLTSQEFGMGSNATTTSQCGDPAYLPRQLWIGASFMRGFLDARGHPVRALCHPARPFEKPNQQQGPKCYLENTWGMWWWHGKAEFKLGAKSINCPILLYFPFSSILVSYSLI